MVIGMSRAWEQGPDRDSVSLHQMLAEAGFRVQEAEVRRMWAPVEIVLAVKESDPCDE